MTVDNPIGVGDYVWSPTPLQDKLNSQGVAALNATELALLPTEKLITSEPGQVVSIDGGWAMVDRGRWGQFGYATGQLRKVQGKEQ